MRKFNWLLVGVMVAGLVLGGIGFANASTSSNASDTGAGSMSRFKGTQSNGISLKNSGSKNSDIATFLGMTVSSLEQERASGKSLATIASEKGKTEDSLVQFIVTKRTDELKTLLSNGKITQKQFDSASSQVLSRVKTMVERTATGSPSWAKSAVKGNRTGSGNCTTPRNP
ncbi:MAG: hypothetical protein ACP5SB_01410 [Caldisericaceae bacterium]